MAHVMNEYPCGCTITRDSAGGHFVNWCPLHKAAPELLEVVQAMATFDGRNNNCHLKEMARAASAKATGQPVSA